MKRKEVRCYTSHPLVGVGWADVWISWHSRRRRIYKGPTLITKADLEGDMWITEECMRKYPDLDFAEQHEDEKRAMAHLKAGRYFYLEGVNNTPEIYTPKDSIDKAEAETMLRYYLEDHGIRRPSLRWKKSKAREFAWPLSVSAPTMEAM